MLVINRRKESLFAKMFKKEIPEKKKISSEKISSFKNRSNSFINSPIDNTVTPLRKSYTLEVSNISNTQHENFEDEPPDYSFSKSDKFLISPDNIFKIIWDLTGMLFIIYQSLIIPYRLCFNTVADPILGYFEIFQDFFFMMDIIITCNTGIFKEGTLIMKRKNIITNYIKFWLWVDFIASFPFQMVVSVESYFDFSSNSDNNTSSTKLLRLLRFMRMMRIIKLVRLVKLEKILQSMEQFIMNSTFSIIVQLIKIFLINLFISHWGACIWYYIGTSQLEIHGISWLSECDFQDSDEYSNYISSIYYFVTTMATVGYGDILPVTPTEKLFTIISMLISSGAFGCTIASINSIVSSWYNRESSFKDSIENFNIFLINRNIQESFRRKVKKYLEFMLENIIEEHIDENEVLEMLNKNLREEVSLQINKIIIKDLDVIKSHDDFCILLTSYIKQEYFNPDENIFEKGAQSSRVYFISKGDVIIYDNETKIIYTKLSKSSIFGEVGFFGVKSRAASSRSINFVGLKYITFNDFKNCSKEYKQNDHQMFEKMKNDVNEFSRDLSANRFESLNIYCYLCDANNHISPNCNKLKIIDELYKFKYIDGKLKTDEEIKKIHQLIFKNDSTKGDNEFIMFGSNEFSEINENSNPFFDLDN